MNKSLYSLSEYFSYDFVRYAFSTRVIGICFMRLRMLFLPAVS